MQRLNLENSVNAIWYLCVWGGVWVWGGGGGVKNKWLHKDSKTWFFYLVETFLVSMKENNLKR